MRLMVSALALMLLAGPAGAQTLAEGFRSPPPEARPLARWWWFGPKVEDVELVREIKVMKQGGFGGFEIQPVYPLSTEGNTSYLSDDFLKAVHLANVTGRAEGMRVDMTLGSGWPFGGPHIPADQASAHIKLVKLPVDPNMTSVVLPPPQAGEHYVAAFVGTDMASAGLLPLAGATLAFTASPAPRAAFVLIQTPTGQQVKRAAVGAEGYVLDHMNAIAVQNHLHSVGDKLMTAFGDQPPYAVFSDSLEVYGADWTGDFLSEFQKRRGYDLTPHLLDLFQDTATSVAVRHDWGLTLSELTESRYLTPINDWAGAHGTKFRSQTYGTPPVTLSSNRLVALPEGEGPQWRKFSTTRWASSANHIYGNAVTSAESWTWLHAGAFRATPLDIKAEADTLMLEGVNQFVAHGWPYSPPEAPEPGQAFYAAAVFNDHNPWWGVMPDVMTYLQRMSWLLRQGEPVADVAVFLPEDDAFAAIKPGAATVNGQMDRYVTEGMTSQILDAGLAFDYTNAEAIKTRGLSARVLILPRVSRIDPDVYKKIEAFAQGGGVVIAVDKTPDSGTGLIDADTDATAVRMLSGRLFGSGVGPGYQVNEAGLGQALKTLAKADVTGAPPQLGFVHRHLKNGDLYFVANTGNTAVTAKLGFKAAAKGQWWDPRLGTAHAWTGAPVTLAPYESRVFVFGAATQGHVTPTTTRTAQTRPLDSGWSIAFKGQAPRPLKTFASWTDDPAMMHYSGTASYTRTLKVTKADLKAGLTVLDFGPGEVVTPPARKQNGTQALLTPPVREAAEVYVNGHRAGAVWTAPFTIDLKPFLHAGTNQIEVRVANTAINELAGRPAADYSALTAKYGERFQAQNMDGLAPLPSGLMRAPTLVTQ